MAIDLPILFPHPLLPRKEMTAAEQAFFREAGRRIKPYVGRASLSIADAQRRNGDIHYRLGAKWKDPTGSQHQTSATGATPGEALASLIAKLRPE